MANKKKKKVLILMNHVNWENEEKYYKIYFKK